MTSQRVSGRREWLEREIPQRMKCKKSKVIQEEQQARVKASHKLKVQERAGRLDEVSSLNKVPNADPSERTMNGGSECYQTPLLPLNNSCVFTLPPLQQHYANIY